MSNAQLGTLPGAVENPAFESVPLVARPPVRLTTGGQAASGTRKTRDLGCVEYTSSLHAGFAVIGMTSLCSSPDIHLIIHSFTPGDWPLPKNPLPDWFKEEKLPEPAKEEF